MTLVLKCVETCSRSWKFVCFCLSVLSNCVKTVVLVSRNFLSSGVFLLVCYLGICLKGSLETLEISKYFVNYVSWVYRHFLSSVLFFFWKIVFVGKYKKLLGRIFLFWVNQVIVPDESISHYLRPNTHRHAEILLGLSRILRRCLLFDLFS